ncbi:hypothetical protein [Alteromonas confluentis]|uniref:Uncharacterized protein n=1 Tax=Alteromonas confluentis TaxID=1656094 RepID=A0A1E7Z7U9_9ALTE|nr:hypothetical protein [Alteromonas confluentis]OFC69605.1 hypothetical protein BFC18_17245 [Alteromonas confluentis]
MSGDSGFTNGKSTEVVSGIAKPATRNHRFAEHRHVVSARTSSLFWYQALQALHCLTAVGEVTAMGFQLYQYRHFSSSFFTSGFSYWVVLKSVY